MIDLETLISPPTADQTYNAWVTQLVRLGVPADTWRQGGSLSTILRVVATSFAGFGTLMQSFIEAGFLDFATGDWLTLLAFYVYGVTRVPATYASGNITLTNGGGGLYTFGPGEVVAKDSTTGETYINTAGFTLNPTSTLTVAFQAVVSGSASSAPIGGIDTLVTTMLGVTISNPGAFVGADPQSDDDLRSMCRNKLGALSMEGPRGAYAYAVTSATRIDGSPVNINRYSISPSSSTGTVTVYVAAPSGTPDPSDITAVENQVEAVARPDTVTASVLAVTAVPVTYALTLYAKATSGIDAPGLVALANTALLAAIATYPIGGIPTPPGTQGYLYGEYVEGVVQGAHPSIYLVTGATDVLLNPGQVATVNVTITARIVVIP